MRWLVKSNKLQIDDELSSYYAMRSGWGNGYVTIHPLHPWYNKDYDEIPVDVHGGLTFAEMITIETLEYWPELKETDLGDYIVGFDTAHYNDNEDNWPKEAVEEEAKRLLGQVLTLNGKYKFLI